MRSRPVFVAIALCTLQACAGGLGNLTAIVQPPRFEQVPDRPAEIRLNGFSGAAVRLWTHVTNPNPFGVRLQTLKGTLFLDESRAADADFPLGLDLGARGDTTLPIDISVNFSDLPSLGGVGRKILARQPVGYRLDGTIGLDAGRLGQGMVFGPMTLLHGETTIR
jgi:hypothetical protein